MKMKTLLLLSALAASTVAAKEKTDSELCMDIHGISTSIMKMRQYQTDLPQVLKLADGNTYLKDITMRAYRKPAYATDVMQKRSIKQFANDEFARCMTALGGE